MFGHMRITFCTKQTMKRKFITNNNLMTANIYGESL